MRHLFNTYLAYIKDNPNHYWFKRKLYGWGWTPATREGWGVILLFIVLIVANFVRIDVSSHSASDTLRPFFVQTAVLVSILIAICYKTGERPKWQWGLGREKADDKSE